MPTTDRTLCRAFELIHHCQNQSSPELTAISTILLTPDRIRAFGDSPLYLSLIGRLIDERMNVSFPEETSLYDTWFSDCLTLSGLLRDHRDAFDQEEWLRCCILLFENLKTPYYEVYSSAALTLLPLFPDPERAGKVLAGFYAVIIKSSAESRGLIRQITDHAPAYRAFPFIDEDLLAQILMDSLSLFSGDRPFWISALPSLLYGTRVSDVKELHLGRLMDDYFNKEECFLKESGIGQKEMLSFPEYRAERALWFASHRGQPADEIIFSAGRKTEGRTVSSNFLNTWAYNMNTAGYVTNPAVGRDQELSDLMLILISPKKSPLILGEAGVGKTALVEGLAWLLARKQVPDLLKDRVIYKLTTTALLSGTKYVGEMEERMRALTDELIRHPEVILFIDEIHTIVGAGSTENSHNDISNMLKPFIDRGDIRLIGATTQDEYSRYILPDRALSRRFYPVYVEEPDPALCKRILTETIPSIEYATRVRNTFTPKETDRLLEKLIAVCAHENQPEGQLTRLPELPLSILEMAFSYAALENRSSLSEKDLITAIRHSSRLDGTIRSNLVFPC